MHRIPSYLFLLFFASFPVAADEWHGINPGISTRADVIREFGECSLTATVCEFNLPGEDVYITLSGPRACPDVAEGTVLLIERQLVDYQSFAALNLDQRRFKKFDPTWPRRIGYQGYIDNKDGLLLKAFNNKVFQIAYIPVITKRQFCPAYYGNPRQFIETYVEHAPPVSIECPKHALTAGKVLSLKAWYNPGLSILLTWYVDGAKLVSGQGRRKIAVDTNGLEGRTIKISVERADSTGFISADSCKVSFQTKGVR